jgi:hypothetical protein
VSPRTFHWHPYRTTAARDPALLMETQHVRAAHAVTRSMGTLYRGQEAHPLYSPIQEVLRSVQRPLRDPLRPRPAACPQQVFALT